VRQLRVLIAEDSPTDAKLVVAELRRAGFAVDFERVETAPAMRDALARGPWDLVISDWSMPHFRAPEALAVVHEAGIEVPFIIVSGTVGEETAVEAMRSGARDFVLKDRLARLAPAVERELKEAAMRVSHTRAEERLRQSEARFARLSESGIIGIAFADVDGNVHDANDAYCQMFGYSREDVLAGRMSWDKMTPPEYAEVDAAAVDRLRRTGVTRPWEKEMLRKDGSRLPLLIGVAMLDETNCIAFAADLSERKQAEAALRRSEDQLRQAQKLEAIGGLAGGVAHDFNNILSVILSYMHLGLEDLSEGDPLRADLLEVKQAALRAAELTRQLLAFSRRQVLQPRVVDLNEVLAGMTRMLERLIGEDVELAVNPGGGLDPVKVDPGQIEQVVMNLAINARDAMPRGGKLTIETSSVVLDEFYAADHPGTEPGPHVMLAVSDSGSGIEPAILARIFDPFFTTKEVGKGTGLGLSTVLGIVQQSGGSIWVYSEPGIGTTFKVYLPVADGPDDLRDPERPVEPADLRGTETVLVVEDDPALRALVRSILRRRGYEVLEAQSGGDALLICEQHQTGIDLLLTDVVMPRMSGRQLAERLLPLRPDMRVIYMSGYTDDAIVHHGVLHSKMAFVQKPITPESLARKVREVLDTPRRA
jgi:two-component system cell cycle sensor histidine kinase/response regulator CckA